MSTKPGDEKRKQPRPPAVATREGVLQILCARMLDKLGAGVVAADPNGPALADNAGRKGRECHGHAQTCTHGLQGGGGAAERGGVVAAGGTFWKSSDA